MVTPTEPRTGPPGGGPRDDGCSTTTSFDTYGIEDGSDLIRGTYYRLVAEGIETVDPSGPFFDRLANSFTHTFVRLAGTDDLPPALAAAIEDATARTAEEVGDDATVDLRTGVLPAFYRRVAGFHCAYRTGTTTVRLPRNRRR